VLGREDAEGPKPFTMRRYESRAPAAKNLRGNFFFYDDKHFMKQEKLTARRKGCDLTA